MLTFDGCLTPRDGGLVLAQLAGIERVAAVVAEDFGYFSPGSDAPKPSACRNWRSAELPSCIPVRCSPPEHRQGGAIPSRHPPIASR